MDESKLIEKLRLIEAIFAEASFEGEKVAPEKAKQRIMARLKQWEKEDPPVEFKFTMGDIWARKVFVALLRRYGIKPYRHHGQRYTTVMAKTSKRFVDETLWPEYQEISETLHVYLSDVTDRVVSQVIHQDSSEADVVEEPRRLPRTFEDSDSGPASSSKPQDKTGGAAAAGDNNAAKPAGTRPKRKGKKRKKRKH